MSSQGPEPAAPRPVRVPALPDSEWSSAIQRVLGPPGRNELPAILEVIANQPSILGPFLQWSAALALEGALPASDAELLALRAAHLCRSEFEWAQHVGYARSAGLDQEIIDRVAEAPESADWAPHERALLAAAGELVERHHIEADTWLVLAEHYETAQLVEIPFIVGQYTMLSMVANSLGIPVAADDPPLPPSVVTTSDP